MSSSLDSQRILYSDIPVLTVFGGGGIYEVLFKDSEKKNYLRKLRLYTYTMPILRLSSFSRHTRMCLARTGSASLGLCTFLAEKYYDGEVGV